MLIRIGGVLGLCALVLIFRLIDHPANFVPVSAAILFAAAYLGRRYAIIVAFAAMLLSDLVIGFYTWQIMSAVYISYAMIAIIASYLKPASSWLDIAGISILSSLLFFFVTNAAVWLWTTMYSHDLVGLTQSYIMGLPFLKNALAGDIFYTCILFTTPRLANKIVQRAITLDNSQQTRII